MFMSVLVLVLVLISNCEKHKKVIKELIILEPVSCSNNGKLQLAL